MYESDITKFLRQYLEEHPEEVESQRKGRAVWWDKTPEERALFAATRLPRDAPRDTGAGTW
jgi:putative aminopeptidase FrvX